MSCIHCGHALVPTESEGSKLTELDRRCEACQGVWKDNMTFCFGYLQTPQCFQSDGANFYTFPEARAVCTLCKSDELQTIYKLNTGPVFRFIRRQNGYDSDGEFDSESDKSDEVRKVPVRKEPKWVPCDLEDHLCCYPCANIILAKWFGDLDKFHLEDETQLLRLAILEEDNRDTTPSFRLYDIDMSKMPSKQKFTNIATRVPHTTASRRRSQQLSVSTALVDFTPWTCINNYRKIVGSFAWDKTSRVFVERKGKGAPK
jgi:hypothetical protein